MIKPPEKPKPDYSNPKVNKIRDKFRDNRSNESKERSTCNDTVTNYIKELEKLK